MRRVVLIFPPQGDPTMPAAAPPLLKAWVERELPDHRVTVIDANVEAYEMLLSASSLSRCAEHVMGERLRLEQEGNLSAYRLQYYCALCRSDLVAPALVREIERAKAVLREPKQFHDYRMYRWASSLVCRSLELISHAHYPASLDIGGFSTPYSTERVSHIQQSIHDKRFNPFLPYYEQRLFPRLAELNPDVVLLSMAYPTQIHQVFYLAAALRDRLAGAKIVLGGSMLPTLLPGIAGAPEILKPFDAVIAYEGELGMVELLGAFSQGSEWGHVSGLVHQQNGTVRINPPKLISDLDTLPVPDFSDHPLELYLSPEPILPFPIGRGCYWGKCAFCCQDETSLNHPRRKSLEKIGHELATARERDGFRYVYMCDEGYEPEFLAQMGDIIVNKNLGLQWSSDARFDKRWTRERFQRAAAGGCVKLWFGLESYNQRILHQMHKGVNIQHIPRILQQCKEAGILVHLYCMFSFPGETMEEAKNTLDFLLSNRELVDTAALNAFRLHQASPMYAQPERYGIHLLPDDSGRDLPHDQPFQTLSGMSAGEAQELCAMIQEHPAMEQVQAPHVLSKAHMLVLAGRDGDYRDALVQSAETHPPLQPDEPMGEIFCITKGLTLQRYMVPVFDMEAGDSAESSTYAYLPGPDRCVRLSKPMASVLQGFGAPGTVESVAQTVGMSPAEVRSATRSLLAGGLLEPVGDCA